MQENQLFNNIKQARSQLNKLKEEAQSLEADPFNPVHNNLNVKEYMKAVQYSLHKNQLNINKKLNQYGDQKTRQNIERNRLPSINAKNQKNEQDLSLIEGKSAYRKQRKHYKHPSQHKQQQSTKIDSSFSLSIQNRPMKIHSNFEKNVRADVTLQYDSQPQIPVEILKLKEQAFKMENQSRIRKSRQYISHNSQKRNLKYIDLNKSLKQEKFDKDILKAPNQVQYNDIVDKYSKHEFMIINGKLINEGPQFMSYSRIYQSIFTKIRIQIAHLEVMLRKKSIKYARFDGKKLAFLCLKDQVKEHELIDCLIDQNDEIKKQLLPKTKYIGKEGRELAVAKIQSFGRMIEIRSKFLTLKSKTLILQNFFRKNLNKLELQRRIHQRNTQIIQRFQSRQEQLVENWKTIRTRKRVQIHFNNMQIDEQKRLSIENFGQRQNIQLSRIFRLKDENLIIIYVSSSQLPPELINYYHRMLQLANIPKYQDRLIFLTPSQSYKFPQHFSVSKLLYYSTKTLKQLKIITEDLPTIIYPGQPSNQLIKICDYLQCYLFTAMPHNIKMFMIKSQSVRFLKNLSLDVLPSAMQMYDYGEFLNTFAVLIMKNIQIKTWVLKIDDEFAGRGIATLDVGKSKILQNLLSKIQYGENNGEFFATDVATQPQNQEITVRIRDYLKDNLPERLKIATPTLYRCYEQYMGKFIKKGGIIQAKPPYSEVKGTYSYPSVSFCLFPSGQFQITTTYQKIMGAPYRSFACSFPQKCLDMKQVNPIITRICQSFKIRKIFGNFTLDFLHYKQKQMPEKLWILDIDPFINNYTTSFYIFNVLMAGEFFPERNSYIVEESDDNLQKNQTYSVETMSSQNPQSIPLSERSYIFIPHCHNSNLYKIKIKQFFKQARREKFNFDIANKEGLCMMLLDQLTSGIISMLAVGRYREQQINLCKKVMQFIVKITQVKNVKYGGTDLEPSNDCINIKDMLSLFVSIVRKRSRSDAKGKAIQKFKNNCDLQFIT